MDLLEEKKDEVEEKLEISGAGGYIHPENINF
jgi:hypothetical protein